MTGFTLVELLVVIIILGLSLSMIGPLAVNQFDKFKARDERISITRELARASDHAFAMGEPIFASGDKNSLVIKRADGSKEVINFKALSMDHLSIAFDRYGTPSECSVSLNDQNGRLFTVEICKIMKNEDG